MAAKKDTSSMTRVTPRHHSIHPTLLSSLPPPDPIIDLGFMLVSRTGGASVFFPISRAQRRGRRGEGFRNKKARAVF